MAKKLSKRALKWIIAVGRGRGRRVRRLSVLEGEANRAAGGDRVGQRPDRGEARRRGRQGAAAGQGGPRRRRRPRQAGPGAGAAGHRHAGGRAGRGQGERRRRAGAAGGRQGLHRQAEERDRARRDRGRRARASSSRRAPARSGSYDVRKTTLETTTAAPRGGEGACCRPPSSRSRSREANAATVQTRIDDATLKSPVTGRVLYRLAEPGEVLGAGGKALTLVNLEDVYMEIFLPSEQAAAREDRRRGADHRRLRIPTARSPATSASSRRRRSSLPSRSRRAASARS